MGKRRSKNKVSSRKSGSKGFFQKLLILTGFTVVIFLAISTLRSVQTDTKTAFCANAISCIKDLTGKFEENQNKATFLGKTVSIPNKLAMEEGQKQDNVLGDNNLSKKIYVDLTTQRLFALENGKVVYDFPVSTGKWYPTPTGTFHIWVKLRYTRMAGGNPDIGTYYNLPNVPYVMFFNNDEVSKSQGFSIHGAYWHNNFGHPMSHGCVNMKIEDAEKIYNWATPTTNGSITYATNDPGTEVTIYGQTPNE